MARSIEVEITIRDTGYRKQIRYAGMFMDLLTLKAGEWIYIPGDPIPEEYLEPTRQRMRQKFFQDLETFESRVMATFMPAIGLPDQTSHSTVVKQTNRRSL